MLEGLEAKELLISQLIDNRFRIDAEYYQKKYLELAKKIELFNPKTINKLHVKLDCSAFYPSIVSDYNFEFNGIPFLRVDDIKAGFVSVTNNTAFLLPKVLDTNQNTIAKAYPGDIIIAKGGNTLGKIGLLTKEYPEYSISRDVLLLRTSVLDDSIRYYLWSFLNSIHGYNLLFRTASQTGQPHLTLASIAEIKVPAFGMEFKVIYKKLFHKIEILKKKSELLYAQSEHIVLNELRLPQFNITKSNQNIKSFKNSFLSTSRLDAEYYQPKYDGYLDLIKNYHNGFKKLTSLCELKNDNYLPNDEDEYKYIELSNIGKFGEITGCTVNSGKKLPSRARRIVRKDDVLISSIEGSLSSCALVTKEYDGAICSTGFYVVNSKEMNSETLLTLFKSELMQNLLKQGCSGTILTAINNDEFKNLLLPVVDSETQQEIAGLIQQSFKLKKQSEQLLEVAKKAVEIAIEQNEATAIDYINSYSELMQEDRNWD